MIRLALMVVCLAIGFGVGVWWGVKNPAQAQKLATEEERRFVEKQKELLERMKKKLDELASARGIGGGGTSNPSTAGATPTGRSSFVGPARAGPARVDPEVEALKKESDQQLQEADKLLGGK